MAVSVLAAATSDNVPGGAILTFAFPITLFAVIAAALYLLLGRPHRRVPARRLAHASASAAAPDATAAHGAAVAAGMPTASGGGSAESAAEAAGARRDTVLGAAGEGGTGSVSGEAGNPSPAGDSGHGTAEGTEASE
ncbi:MAG TPA: hypothetical protein VMI33_10965 [Streptosporangiaceae bacterium]|nr:hypothetical protein [Streptosporangiaceae bacterium]